MYDRTKLQAIPSAVILDETPHSNFERLAIIYDWNNGTRQIAFDTPEKEDRFINLLFEGRIAVKDLSHTLVA